MNKVASQKYGFSPDFVEEKTLNDENFTIFIGQLKFQNLLKDMNVVILNQIEGFVKPDRGFYSNLKFAENRQFIQNLAMKFYSKK